MTRLSAPPIRLRRVTQFLAVRRRRRSHRQRRRVAPGPRLRDHQRSRRERRARHRDRRRPGRRHLRRFERAGHRTHWSHDRRTRAHRGPLRRRRGARCRHHGRAHAPRRGDRTARKISGVHSVAGRRRLHRRYRFHHLPATGPVGPRGPEAPRGEHRGRRVSRRGGLTRSRPMDGARSRGHRGRHDVRRAQAAPRHTCLSARRRDRHRRRADRRLEPRPSRDAPRLVADPVPSFLLRRSDQQPVQRGTGYCRARRDREFAVGQGGGRHDRHHSPRSRSRTLRSGIGQHCDAHVRRHARDRSDRPHGSERASRRAHPGRCDRPLGRADPGRLLWWPSGCPHPPCSTRRRPHVHRGTHDRCFHRHVASSGLPVRTPRCS